MKYCEPKITKFMHYAHFYIVLMQEHTYLIFEAFVKKQKIVTQIINNAVIQPTEHYQIHLHLVFIQINIV